MCAPWCSGSRLGGGAVAKYETRLNLIMNEIRMVNKRSPISHMAIVFRERTLGGACMINTVPLYFLWGVY